ncbi:heat shock protein 70kda [Holotrichia oblita]|nr:heat shock protein 70kda [Holotrichia oblita]
MAKILGIDLGTSTSEIAVIENGKPVIIPNHLGKFITPSVVHIAEDGSITVGEEAVGKLLLEPECTFYEFKRAMGEDKKFTAHGKKYSPEELSSMVLSYLAETARNFLGETPEKAVITVPAYFTDAQRRATVEAGKLAGLEVCRIINEPTAAALDYGIENMEACENILVYDFGGGTLDVTVLEMFNGIIEVKSSCGNNKLGGKDFDEALIDYLCERFRKKHGTNVKNDLRAMSRLKKSAEECKIALSTETENEISLPFFSVAGGKPVSLSETVSKETYEGLIAEKVYSTKTQIITACDEANLKPDEIDLVLLVGGTTKTPFVVKFMEDTMGVRPRSILDPVLAVVRGACIQAAIINSEMGEDGIIFTDVCPYTLGTSVLSYGILDVPRMVFDTIIPRNSTIPVTREKDYMTVADYQEAVEIKVYQGENRDPERNQFLNAFFLDGIPPARSGKEKVRVEFTYDINGILQVEATILSTGKKAGIEILTTGVEMKPEIDVSLWDKHPQAKKYRPLIRRCEKLVASGDLIDPELEDNLLELKKILAQDGDIREADEIKEEILALLVALEDD